MAGYPAEWEHDGQPGNEDSLRYEAKLKAPFEIKDVHAQAGQRSPALRGKVASSRVNYPDWLNRVDIESMLVKKRKKIELYRAK